MQHLSCIFNAHLMFAFFMMHAMTFKSKKTMCVVRMDVASKRVNCELRFRISECFHEILKIK